MQKKLRANKAEVTLVNKNEYHYQSTALHESSAGTLHHDRTRVKIKDVVNFNKINFVQAEVISRSEERRVGKEGRSRWSPERWKKTTMTAVYVNTEKARRGSGQF